jgi:ferredoxin
MLDDMSNDTATTSSPEHAGALALSSETPDGRAREAALQSGSVSAQQSTSLVPYRSGGSLVIIDEFKLVGDEERAIGLAEQLSGDLRCSVLIGGIEPGSTQLPVDKKGSEYTLATGRLAQLSGHLGQFTALLDTPDGEVNLARHLHTGREHFDLVLDLTQPPYLRHDTLPLGYYAPHGDPQSLARILQELPGMVGDFEKPKFFHYNPDICAHGSSGLHGCTRCLDACPTSAISSAGDKIDVDVYLCQGGGSCATVCPSGAITYAYPAVNDLLEAVRTMLTAYRDAGGQHPTLLFHDAAAGRDHVARLAARLPENVIPIEIEEVGAVGMDLWLAALAYGASHVVLLATPAIAPSVLGALGVQLEYAGAILAGMEHSPERLQLIMTDGDAATLEALQELAPQPLLRPAGFAALDEKRTTIRLAVDHLYSQAPAPRPTAALPVGAPFGAIEVNRTACTLCMACVSVCPASALSDAGDQPQLLFTEWNCVQCGLCETACPEDAISLAPRFVYDPEDRQVTRTLNEEEPFCCVVCGKPFATQSMMARMQEKLKGHWMFQDANALRRLQMCEDCRVKDMFQHERGGIDVHKGR